MYCSEYLPSDGALQFLTWQCNRLQSYASGTLRNSSVIPYGFLYPRTRHDKGMIKLFQSNVCLVNIFQFFLDCQICSWLFR